MFWEHQFAPLLTHKSRCVSLEGDGITNGAYDSLPRPLREAFEENTQAHEPIVAMVALRVYGFER